MAARFAKCSDELIQNLKEMWKTWVKQAGYSEDTKSYQPESHNFASGRWGEQHVNILYQCSYK